jgi:hypothetical protein
MNNSPVLPVNPIETAEAAAHAIQGTTLVQVCPTGPGFGLLAMILGYPPGCLPPEAHALEYIAPRYISSGLKAWPRSTHARPLKMLTGDLATGLPPTVW